MASACGDVLSLEDLKTAKLHQVFEAEVITGKAGGVASGADIDYATNPVTGQVQKTLPAVLRDSGFTPVAWDFSTGGTLAATDRNKVVYDPVSKVWYSWAGTLPKVVPAGTNPLSDSDWKPRTDTTLRTDLATNNDLSKGDAMIAVRKSFTGAGATTQHEVNERTCHINDFPSSPASTWLQRAINGTPDGWTLQLGPGPYLANINLTRSNITIRGLGAPGASSDRTRLKSTGTLIYGKLLFTGSDITLSGFGVDNGNYVIGAYFSGVEGDALVVSNVGTSTTPNANNHINDVTTLAKLGSTTSHSCLLENFINGSVVNVRGYGGFVGVVCKIQNSFIDKIAGYRNTQSGVQFKSNSYAKFAGNKIGAVHADAEGLDVTDSVGIFIYSFDEQLEKMSGGDFSSVGFYNGVGITQTSGTVINDLNINSITANAPKSMGFSTFGAMLNVNIGRIQVNGSVSGRSVRINEDTLGTNIGTIQASSVSGLNLDDSVYIGGVCQVDSILAVQAYNPTIPTGITVVKSATAGAARNIGQYVGRLVASAITMLNGWTGTGGNTPTVRLTGRMVTFNGYIAVPGTRTGAEQFVGVGAALAPSTAQFMPAVGFVNGSSQAIPLIVAVNTAGALYFPYLSNTTAFPTSVTAVAVNISWPIG